MNYLTYRSNALQGLSKVKDINLFTKDDIEDYIKSEYVRHYPDNKDVV